MVLTDHFYFNIYSNVLNMLYALVYFDVLGKWCCLGTVSVLPAHFLNIFFYSC